jgi:hypothetical protein
MSIACIVALIIGGIEIFGERKEVAGIYDFQVERRNGGLIKSFSLVDTEGRLMPEEDVRVYVGLSDGRGNLTLSHRRFFHRRLFSFLRQPKEYLVGYTGGFEDRLRTRIPYGRPAFTPEQVFVGVVTNDNRAILTAEYPLARLYSAEEIERIRLLPPMRDYTPPAWLRIFEKSRVGD